MAGRADAQPRLARAVGAAGEPGAPDPVADREAFRSRCGAWERQRHFDTAYGFGIFLRRRFVGEVSLGSVQRGPFQSASSATGSTSGTRVRATARGLASSSGRVRELGLHRIEVAIVPRNRAAAGSRQARVREEGLSVRFLQIHGVWEDHVRYAITLRGVDGPRDEIEQSSSPRSLRSGRGQRGVVTGPPSEALVL